MSGAGAPALPALLQTNPRLDQWVRFETPGRVTVATGRVEIGQGVLTAMLQMAADELDVAPDRIDLKTGDTDVTPNEGYTAGSQSIQYGGVALRLALAETRGLILDKASARLGCTPAELSVRDGAILKDGAATGLDYWSLAGEIDLPPRHGPDRAEKGRRSAHDRRQDPARRSRRQGVRRADLCPSSIIAPRRACRTTSPTACTE